MKRALGLVLVAGMTAAACGDDGGGSDGAGTTATDDTTITNGDSSTESTAGKPAEAPLDEIDLTLTPIAEAEAPTALVSRPGSDALYVAERAGVVRLVTISGTGADRTYDVGEALLDIRDEVVTDAERGLLDIEFSAAGDILYVSYSLAPDGDTRIAAYDMAGDTVDTSSRRQILAVEQPYPNHNGGDIEVGPDELLYVALGDGGSGGDPHGNGQDTGVLLGKILRIDPTRPAEGEQYGIPDDNPFADGQAGRPEVWIYGVRNPWRISFDRATDDLWVADVGQNEWEEIDLLPAADGGGGGANLGWNGVEGTHDFDGGNPDGGVLPVFEYSHDEGCSVTGGVVYRGEAIAGLDGAYLFGDFCAGQLRALRARDGEVVEQHAYDASVVDLVSFGEDADGEVYVLSLGGDIYRLDGAT